MIISVLVVNNSNGVIIRYLNDMKNLSCSLISLRLASAKILLLT